MKTIKAILISIVLIQFGAEEILAQQWGVKTGLTYCNVENSEGLIEIKPLIGFHLGPTVEFNLSDNWGLETGLVITQKGYKYEYSESIFLFGSFSIKEKVTMYYVDIPITPKVYFDAGNARIFGQLGPMVSVGVAGTYKSEFTSGGMTETEKGSVEWFDFKDRIHFGLVAGAGVDLDPVTIGVNYNYGVSNEFDSDGHFRYVNVSLGYHF